MRTGAEAVTAAQGYVGKLAPGGPGHCQEFVRTCLGLPAWGASAKIAAAKVPASERHIDIKNAPAGAMVFFPTLSDYGHVVLSDGKGGCFSNDYVQHGYIGHVNDVTLPNWHGSTHSPFYTLWTPFGHVK